MTRQRIETPAGQCMAKVQLVETDEFGTSVILQEWTETRHVPGQQPHYRADGTVDYMNTVCQVCGVDMLMYRG